MTHTLKCCLYIFGCVGCRTRFIGCVVRSESVCFITIFFSNVYIYVLMNCYFSDNKVSRKPPRVPFSSTAMSDAGISSESLTKPQPNCARVRSASTGRDKRSELQARYWGLLFGNLQRAVNFHFVFK